MKRNLLIGLILVVIIAIVAAFLMISTWDNDGNDDGNDEGNDGGSVSMGITVMQPIANTTYARGQVCLISWTTENITGNVDIKITGGGALGWVIQYYNTENTGNYTWHVQAAAVISDDWQVKISSVDDSSIYGESDKFSITE